MKYFNENYGTKVVMSGPEAAAVVGSLINPDDIIVGSDGKTLTLGNTTITMVHTPRSMTIGSWRRTLLFHPCQNQGKAAHVGDVWKYWH